MPIRAASGEGLGELLSDYLRVDSTNPPGDTRTCVEWLGRRLEAVGIAWQALAHDPLKPNLVASLSEGANALVLHHHMDVVPVTGQPWTVEPFGGLVRDGYVHGRGALDMKGFGVLALAAIAAAKSSGRELRRPLRFLATSDEEIGGAEGAGWLAEAHFEETAGEFLWTEGSFATPAGAYPIQTSETGVAAFRLTARGRPGHASVDNPENPIVRLASVLPALAASRLRPNPTVLEAGASSNVVPATASCVLDVRTPPGSTVEEVAAEIMGSAGSPEWLDIELVRWGDGTSSSDDSELMSALRDAILAERSGATITTVQGRIGTDARPYRPRGVTCYGLVPFELDAHELAGMHGPDERVSIENLERGLRIMLGVVERLCFEGGGAVTTETVAQGEHPGGREEGP
ncbi:MAG: M20/M25/M40 family metallo-hydrolase [Dehalococcoidia bacterium]